MDETESSCHLASYSFLTIASSSTTISGKDIKTDLDLFSEAIHVSNRRIYNVYLQKIRDKKTVLINRCFVCDKIVDSTNVYINAYINTRCDKHIKCLTCGEAVREFRAQKKDIRGRKKRQR